MISVNEARERILSMIKTVETESIPLTHALGRVLGEEIAASEDIPPFDNSSVDGFAVHSGSVSGSSSVNPVLLRVTGDIPAGTPPGIILAPEAAMRIMTGAPIPDGADAVVMIEDTDLAKSPTGSVAPLKIAIKRSVSPTENIRFRGSDLRAGEIVFSMGHRLKPADIGILAQLGVGRLKAYRRPRIALFSSGDELISVDSSSEFGKVRDANFPMLSALLNEAGADVLPLGIAHDNQAEVESLLERATNARADLIISTAGVSVGAFDFVRAAIESNGSLEFWRVNMRPGKPLACGWHRNTPFIGLPGNPVSAYVGFLLFVLPAFFRMMGASEPPRRLVHVRTSQTINTDGRETYLRGIVREQKDGLVTEIISHQGSGNLFALTRANALLIIPSGVKSVPPGEEVVAWLL